MSASSQRPSFREIVTDRTLALILLLGFGSGLPLLLILSTQTTRLKEAKLPIETVTLLTWAAFFYALKFLWAPIIDGYDVPGLARLLGRRRAWLLTSQVGVMAGLFGLAIGDPAQSLEWIILCATFTGFMGATQDIVVDAWRIDAGPPERQGVLAATYNLGYRLALICAGAGALYLADYAGWRPTYAAMALLMLIPTTAGLLAPRLPERVRTGAEPTLAEKFAEPLADLAKRYGASLGTILLLVALYRLPDFLTGVLANPLYIDLGFSKSEIATMVKVYGIWVGVAGAFAGGFAITRFGLMPALLVGGIAAAASHLCLAWLAAAGKSIVLLALSVSVEQFAGNFAGAALIAYMSSLTSPTYQASQYALLSSLYALLGKFLGGLSGYGVAAVGYPTFFVASSMIGIPVAILCLMAWRDSRNADLPSPACGRRWPDEVGSDEGRSHMVGGSGEGRSVPSSDPG